jgi:hypothetical protein
MLALGQTAIQDMFDGIFSKPPAFGLTNEADMYDIASRLVMKWARHRPEHRILATDDLTRLTLDSLALCNMNLRFNSFYKDELHPFVHAMVL